MRRLYSILSEIAMAGQELNLFLPISSVTDGHWTVPAITGKRDRRICVLVVLNK